MLGSLKVLESVLFNSFLIVALLRAFDHQLTCNSSHVNVPNVNVADKCFFIFKFQKRHFFNYFFVLIKILPHYQQPGKIVSKRLHFAVAERLLKRIEGLQCLLFDRFETVLKLNF